MTIIAYRDGIVAADSLVVGGGENAYKLGSGPKLFKIDGGIVAHCGASSASQIIQRWLENGRDGDIPASPDGMVIWFPRNGPISIIGDGSESIIDYRAPYYAWGSGEQFALGAMWKGADAKEAVEAAISFSTGCEGPVTTMRVNVRV